MVSYIIDHYLYPQPQESEEQYEHVLLSNHIPCMVYGNAKTTGRCIVYVHGNAETLSSLHESGLPTELQRHTNSQLFTMELPGYGNAPSTRMHGNDRDKQCCEYLHGVLRTLKRRGATNIVVIGRSLGVAVVLKTFNLYPKLHNNTCQLFLISGFTSVQDLCPKFIKHFVKNRFCNTQNITMLPRNVKVCIIHGTKDMLIPFSHAQALHAARRESELVSVENMDHNPDANEMAHIVNIVSSRVHSIYGKVPMLCDGDKRITKCTSAAHDSGGFWDMLCALR